MDTRALAETEQFRQLAHSLGVEMGSSLEQNSARTVTLYQEMDARIFVRRK